MRQPYAYVANESTRRLVEDGMSAGLTNTHTARGFSVLHYVIKVTLLYLMLHRFEIHSALELSGTALLGCSLAINKKLKEHLNLLGFKRALQCPFSASYIVVSRILSYSSLGGTSERKQNNRPERLTLFGSLVYAYY